MRDAYTEKEITDIEIVARVMTFSNLSANTLDALLSRFKGVPAAGSRALDELVIAFCVLGLEPTCEERLLQLDGGLSSKLGNPSASLSQLSL